MQSLLKSKLGGNYMLPWQACIHTPVFAEISGNVTRQRAFLSKNMSRREGHLGCDYTTEQGKCKLTHL